MIALVGMVGCVEHQEGVTGTQSLKVELLPPTDPGTPDDRLDPSAPGGRDVTIRVTAYGPDNMIDTDFNFEVGVRSQFLGAVTPPIVDQNIPQIRLTAGVSAPTTVTLPPQVFGPAVVWIEDGGDGGTYATGTSPTLWYRDPFIADIQRPADETAIDALIASPLEDRQVRVEGSRYNDPALCPTEDCGRLIVTSIYAQGYTVSDVACGPGGTPPCVAGDYDHLLIFTFQRPRDENFCDIVVGQFIDGFGGAVSEFNGLTEIGFPQTFVAATEGRNPDEFNYCDGRVVDPAALPPPAPIENDWLTNKIEFERAEAGLVSIDSAVLMPGFPVACPLDMEYDQYMQWEMDIGSGCGSPISAITSGSVSSWIPEDHVGQQLTRVVGSLRPVNFASGGGVWIVYPRSEADLVP
jgi:hypothetical protein